MTITEKAQKYSDMFESGTRTDGSNYVFLKNHTLEGDLYESIKATHGDSMPSDWIYGTYADLMQKVTEYDLKTIDDLEDVRHEIVDSYVDVYTHDLTKWLASDINNVNYLTQAMEEGIYEDTDGFKLLAQAQYRAIDEVMNEVVNLLSK